MKIGFLGPKGTYTELAVDMYNSKAEKIPFQSISAVFEALAKNKVDLALVPIENMIQGPVTETYDNLFSHTKEMQITDAVLLPIEHAIGKPHNSKVNKILSRDTALEQCSDYLKKNFPNAEKVPVDSTAKAIEMTSKMKDAAAIGMESTLKGHGLEILDKNIGNVKDNKTKFVILSKEEPKRSKRNFTSIVVYPKRDRVGFLEDLLKIISKDHKLNMSSIHSRPDGKGQFRFYIELEGHVNDKSIKDCIRDIQKRLSETDVVTLGSYPYLPYNERSINTIAIIGGTGQMGIFFKPFFESLGYKVLINGRNSGPNYEECIKQAEVILINVPIEVTVDVINKIGPMMRKGQLLVDNTGVKSKVVDTMMKSTKDDVEVLSLHTMFGPNIESLVGENIISVHTKKTKALAKEFEDVFYKHGARITVTTPEHHDVCSTICQSLEHVTNVAKAKTMMELVGHPSKLLAFLTPNAREALQVEARIHNSDPHLYAEMLKENSFALSTLENFADILNKIISSLKKKDYQAFEKLMNSNKEKLGKDFIEKQLSTAKQVQELLKKE